MDAQAADVDGVPDGGLRLGDDQRTTRLRLHLEEVPGHPPQLPRGESPLCRGPGTAVARDQSLDMSGRDLLGAANAVRPKRKKTGLRQLRIGGAEHAVDQIAEHAAVKLQIDLLHFHEPLDEPCERTGCVLLESGRTVRLDSDKIVQHLGGGEASGRAPPGTRLHVGPRSRRVHGIRPLESSAGPQILPQRGRLLRSEDLVRECTGLHGVQAHAQEGPRRLPETRRRGFATVVLSITGAEI